MAREAGIVVMSIVFPDSAAMCKPHQEQKATNPMTSIQAREARSIHGLTAISRDETEAASPKSQQSGCPICTWCLDTFFACLGTRTELHFALLQADTQRFIAEFESQRADLAARCVAQQAEENARIAAYAAAQRAREDATLAAKAAKKEQGDRCGWSESKFSAYCCASKAPIWTGTS